VKSKQTVIVTGASSDIGSAIANAYLERGYNAVEAVRYLTDSTFTNCTVLPVDGGAIAGFW
jgi:NADP-dependent 3-hydroxy acid dehydrogenase YdfG